MGPIAATLRCLARPFTWSGRAAPSEYWWFTAVFTLASFAVWIGLFWPLFVDLAAHVGGRPSPYGANIDAIVVSRFEMAGWAMLIGLWPTLCHLAVLIRRLHDTDRSGWWYWICLVPLVGPFILLVLLILPGDPGRNDYGKPPGGPLAGEVGRPGAGVAKDLPPLDPALRAPVAMGPLRATLSCLAAPFTWRGRAGPGEYWWFMLVSVCASTLAVTYLAWPVFAEINAWEAAVQAEQRRAYETITAVQPIPFPDLRPALEQNAIGWMIYLALCLPVGLSSLAVMVRRLHDTDHSGWWYWISLVPLIGVLFLIVLLVAPGQIHRNRFGPGRGVERGAPVRGSDMPVVPRDPLSDLRGADALRALRQSRMEGSA